MEGKKQCQQKNQIASQEQKMPGENIELHLKEVAPEKGCSVIYATKRYGPRQAFLVKTKLECVSRLYSIVFLMQRDASD